MYHSEGPFADHSRIFVRRNGRAIIDIRPHDFQAGDIICDKNGTPLRDKRTRKMREKAEA